jgi:large subunit ribosomal protein L15
MVVKHRKKNTRAHGRTTHGYGSMKKHRGAGNRGGRGMAGSGKRADQIKTWILKEYGPEYFGKHGFKIPPSIKKKEVIVNIRDLPDQESINLTEQGFTKLLAKGTPKRKYHITVAACSEKAKQKIEKMGGKVELPS